jgi:hypothetical protein
LQSKQTFQQPVAQPPAAQQPVPAKTQKNAVGAAIASAVWCGLGQTYNGQLQKGLGLWLGLLLFYTLFYALMNTGGGFFIIFVLIIWGYGISDAYTTSTKMNAGQIPFAETNIGHIIIFIIGSITLAFIISSIATAATSDPFYSYYY